jgi:hypothetical protein
MQRSKISFRAQKIELKWSQCWHLSLLNWTTKEALLILLILRDIWELIKLPMNFQLNKNQSVKARQEIFYSLKSRTSWLLNWKSEELILWSIRLAESSKIIPFTKEGLKISNLKKIKLTTEFLRIVFSNSSLHWAILFFLNVWGVSSSINRMLRPHLSRHSSSNAI